MKVAFEWFRTQPHFVWNLAGKPVCSSRRDTSCMLAEIDKINAPVSMSVYIAIHLYIYAKEIDIGK